MNIGIILAGGAGKRVGAIRPKQFINVLGKPVLAYTCEIFQRNERIDAIEIVSHCDWIDYCREMKDKYGLSKVLWIIPGGETFQDSVINGVRHLESLLGTETSLDDNIFIQYGGAPFTSQKIVNAVIEMTEERESAVTATPCYQLLAERDTDTTSTAWADRDRYIQIACPYGFRFSYILGIYKRAEQRGLLETIEPHTTSLMYALGETINYAYGDQTNIKITTQEDIAMFEGYILQKRHYSDLRKSGKVIVLLADGFEDCEALLVVAILRRANIDVLTVSISENIEVESSKNIKMYADTLIENVDFDSAELIFLPGGQKGVENLVNCKTVRERCIEFAQNKHIAAVCAAPSILTSLGLLSGKHAICHPDFNDQMKDVKMQDENVIKNGNIITGRGFGSVFPLIFELVKIFAGEKTVNRIKDEFCYY